MFEDNWIVVAHVFCGTQQIRQRLIEFAFSKLNPTETIEVRTVVWFQLERALNHFFGFIQVHAVVRPHVTEIIVGFCRGGRIECDGFAKQVSRFVIQTRLLGCCAVIEVEFCVYDFIVLIELCFVQCLLKSGDRLLSLSCLALGEREIIHDFRRPGEPATGFGEKFHRAFGIFERPKEQLRQTQIDAGVVGVNEQALFVVCSHLGKLRFGFIQSVFALKRPRFVV